MGEKVLRLEERLGYTHKGVAKDLSSSPRVRGLAARISGDTAVAFSWAYCAALSRWARRVLHLAGWRGPGGRTRESPITSATWALGNDAGLPSASLSSPGSEDLLRTNAATLGARYLLDFLVPGGVTRDLPAGAPAALMAEQWRLDAAVRELRAIYDDHPGLQDRFREAGLLEGELARKLGAVGLAGRASGIARDLRVDQPWPRTTGPAEDLRSNRGRRGCSAQVRLTK